MKKVYFSVLIGLVSFFCLQKEVSAQISMKASVVEEEVLVNTPFHIAYELTNVQGEFSLPKSRDIEFLQVVDKQMSESIVNGKRSIKKNIVLSAVAKKTGKISLGPATVTMGSKKYRTNSLTISVQDRRRNNARNRGRSSQRGFSLNIGPNGVTINTTPSQPSQPQPQRSAPQNKEISSNVNDYIFVKTTVDKNTAFKGEQIHAVTKLYYRTNFQIEPPAIPKYPGFWVEDNSPENPSEDISVETINGNQYNVITVSDKILIPQKEGILKIPNYELNGVAEVPEYETVEMDDPFEDMFSNSPFANSPFANSPVFQNMRQLLREQSRAFRQMRLKTVDLHLNSGEKSITIKPTPRDKNGNIVSVGKYMMSVELKKNEFSLDEIDTLLVTIRGNGNPSFIYTPKWENKDIEVLDIIELDSITQRTPSIKSFKQIYYLFAANHDGHIDLSPVSFTFFDPESEAMSETVSDSFHIHVTPGKELSKNESIAQNRTRPLHKITSTKHTSYFVTKGAFWALLGLPLLALVVLGYTEKIKGKEPKIQRKDKIARAEAMKRLDSAKAYLQQQNNEAYYQELSKALWLYISDRSGIELADMNRERALEYLESQNISPDRIAEFEKLIDQSQKMLYASGDLSQTKKEDYDRALELISSLEQELKR